MRTPITSLSLILMTTVAVADDKPAKPATVVPTRAVPCAPDDTVLLVQNDQPVVCWANGCMEIDPNNQAAKLVKRPAAQPAWLGALVEIRPEAGKVSTCRAGKCKPLGAKLAAAVDAARKAATVDEPVTITGTTDLKAVLIRSDVWNVATDKKITLKPPSRKGERPSVVGVDPAGDLLLVHWSACAGPCTEAQLTDSAGNNVGKVFVGGGPLMQLDAKRFITISEWADITIFPVGGSTPKGSLKLGSNAPGALAVVRLGEDLGVLRDVDGGKRFTRFGTFENKLAAQQDMFLPSCAP